MSKRRVVYRTPDGDHATPAPIDAGMSIGDGTPFIWLRTRSGEIRRAWQTREVRDDE